MEQLIPMYIPVLWGVKVPCSRTQQGAASWDRIWVHVLSDAKLGHLNKDNTYLSSKHVLGRTLGQRHVITIVDETTSYACADPDPHPLEFEKFTLKKVISGFLGGLEHPPPVCDQKLPFSLDPLS